MNVFITDDAEEDLNQIFDFIMKGSEYYAYHVTWDIRNWCDLRLSAMPRAGKMITDVPIETRQVVWPYKYSIRYMIIGDTVHITMIYKHYK